MNGLNPELVENFATEILALLNEKHDRASSVCLMGLSGSGKTRLLRATQRILRLKQVPTILLEATRNFTGLSGHLQWQTPNPSDFENLIFEARESIFSTHVEDVARKTHEIGSSASSLLSTIIKTLSIGDDLAQANYKSSIEKWFHDRTLPEPKAPESAIRKLEEFLHGITGYQCRVTFAGHNKYPDLEFYSESNRFGIDGLSMGEKMELLLFAFQLSKPFKEQFVILVDEPEVHLNEARAISLWESIETRNPNAVFVYATHSAIFSSRAEVDKIFCISRRSNLERIPNTSPLPQHLVRDFVGARVQVSRGRGNIVFCEDELTQVILMDFLDSSFEIVFLEGRETVKQAVSGERHWTSIRSAGSNAVGVIDRDVADDQEIEDWKKKNILVLPYYDAESILLTEQIMGRRLESTLDRSQYKNYGDLIASSADGAFMSTLKCIKESVLSRYRGNIECTFDGNSITKCEVTPAEDVKNEFLKRYQLAKSAVDSRDLDRILTTVKGKVLFNTVANRLRSVGIGLSVPRIAYEEVRREKDFRQRLLSIPRVDQFLRSLNQTMT